MKTSSNTDAPSSKKETREHERECSPIFLVFTLEFLSRVVAGR